MKARAAAFDFDGTLFDSMGIWEGLAEGMLRRRKMTPQPDLRERLAPLSLRQAAEYLIAHYGLRENAEALMREANDAIEGFYRDEAPLKPGAADFIAALAGQNIPLCVVTASDEAHVRLALARVGLLSRFSFLLTCTGCAVAKDDPAFYRMAALRLGVAPQEMLVFEDAPHAAETARRAGCPVVGVYDRFSARGLERLSAVTEKIIVSFDEMNGTLL